MGAVDTSEYKCPATAGSGARAAAAAHDEEEDPPPFYFALGQVDWTMLCCLSLFLNGLFYTNRGGKHRCQHTKAWHMMTFLALATYRYSLFEYCDSLCSDSIWNSIVESCRMFTVFHNPVESPRMVIVYHLATYWTALVAYHAKTLRGMLLYLILYELLTAFNEYAHYADDEEEIWYSRDEFVNEIKQYAVDDIIRSYVLGPLMVYLYLLPKSILEAGKAMCSFFY